MIANIQVLRCFAALVVVWHHIQGPLNGYLGMSLDTGFGGAGVDVFFVVSGFIMFHTNEGFPRTTGQFWLDRFVRIAPLYWIATWMTIAMLWAGIKPLRLVAIDPGDIVAAVAFIPDIRADGMEAPILSAGWTLNFEMFFYLLFGLTFFLRNQTLSLILLTGAFLTFWLVSLVEPLPFPAHMLAQPITLEFAAGGALALLSRHLPTPASAQSIVVGYALIALGAAGIAASDIWLHTLLYGQDIVRDLGFGIPAAAIVGGALLLERAGHVWRSRTLLLLGSASFAIYLFHPAAIQLTAKVVIGVLKLPVAQTATIAALAAFIASLLVGVAVHLLVEKPLQIFLKRRTRGWFARKPRDVAPSHTIPAE